MYKIVINDKNKNIMFSKFINEEIIEIDIKTNNKEINFLINEKVKETKSNKINELFQNDNFWDD